MLVSVEDEPGSFSIEQLKFCFHSHISLAYMAYPWSFASFYDHSVHFISFASSHLSDWFTNLSSSSSSVSLRTSEWDFTTAAKNSEQLSRLCHEKTTFKTFQDNWRYAFAEISTLLDWCWCEMFIHHVIKPSENVSIVKLNAWFKMHTISSEYGKQAEKHNLHKRQISDLPIESLHNYQVLLYTRL
jgi:hypothetical protein